MKQIPLTRGLFALVDDSDFERLTQMGSWSANKNRRTFYAEHGTAENTTVKMHRVIVGAKQNEQVDHRDGNGLNNQRFNLRYASHAQNQANRRVNQNNSTGYKGVVAHHGKFVAKTKVDGVSRHLGSFGSAEDAARAYDTFMLERFGDFAKLNFPLLTK